MEVDISDLLSDIWGEDNQSSTDTEDPVLTSCLNWEPTTSITTSTSEGIERRGQQGKGTFEDLEGTGSAEGFQAILTRHEVENLLKKDKGEESPEISKEEEEALLATEGHISYNQLGSVSGVAWETGTWSSGNWDQEDTVENGAGVIIPQEALPSNEEVEERSEKEELAGDKVDGGKSDRFERKRFAEDQVTRLIILKDRKNWAIKKWAQVEEIERKAVFIWLKNQRKHEKKRARRRQRC